MDIGFYKGKNVLITGHTGFKGTWLCQILLKAGANITGYALEPPTDPALFKIAGIENKIRSIYGDIRNFELLMKTFIEAKPEIVIHMAAQPIVLAGYQNPRETYEINVMGTVNILECIRQSDYVCSFLNVTTDKVYQNNEWIWGYRENDILNGFDPYSNSKSCSELVTSSYMKSFFAESRKIAISTARAGNVIGGGDFASNRIIPDCVRAAIEGKQIQVRNPHSIRPYQHVLEPLCAYLTIAGRQYEDIKIAGNYNVGPDDCDCITTRQLVDSFCKYWGNGLKSKIEAPLNAPHESNFLRLDCTKIKTLLGWKPHWHIDYAIEKTVELTKALQTGGSNIDNLMNHQIREYLEE